MKKFFTSAISAAMLLSLCSCGSGGIENAPDITETQALSAVTEETAGTVSSAAADTSAETENIQDAQDGGEFFFDGPIDVSEYMEIKEYGTPLGIIAYPCFSTENLDKADAEAANAFFENLMSELAEDAEEASSGSGEAAENYLDLVSYYAGEGILSVSMRYSFRCLSPVTRNTAVNFDLSTGKQLCADEMIKKFGFTEEDIENSIRWYSRARLFRSAQYGFISECCESGVLPDKMITEESSWKKACDTAAEKFRSDEEKAVYFEYGTLYACAAIPYDPIGELYGCMVSIGHSGTETASRNKYNFFDPISDRPYLSPEGAADKVKYFLGYDNYTDISAERTDIIPICEDPDGSGEVYYPVYIMRVNTGENGRDRVFAAGMIDDIIWEYNEASGEYEIIINGSPMIDYSEGFYLNALGVIVRAPDEYCKWSLDPVAEFDLSGGDPYAETVLVCALYERTEVTVLKGTVSPDDWEFSGEEAVSFTLDTGDYALIKCSVPEVIPEFAVSFSANSDKGTYIISYDGRGERNTMEYAFSDYAVG